jgi:hypothetical protein
MNKLLASTAALVVLVSASAYAEDTAATYAQIEQEIGCASKATDAKKGVLFQQKYENRWVTWKGAVHDVKGHSLWLNDIGSHSIGSDFDVEMVPSVDLLQFDKEQKVTVRFQIKDYMGCILPLKGINGTIIN